MKNNLKQQYGKILGFLVSSVFIGLIIWKLDVHQLVETFKLFNYKVLFVFIPLYVLSLYIRGFRWRYLLCGSSKLTTKEAFFAFTTGNTLNSYLPARAGDFWRAYFIGNKLEESKMKMLGSIILERIIDGISILMLLVFAVIMYCKKDWVLNITYISTALFIGSIILLYFVVKFNKTDYIFQKLSEVSFLKKYSAQLQKTAVIANNFISGLQALNDAKCFSIAFVSSCVAWGIECLITYVLIMGFGYDYGFSVALFVISFIALSTIIPSSSVFVGPYQFAYIMALNLYHISKSSALGIAFIHQVLIMILVTIITVIYFLISGTDLNKIKNVIGEESNAGNTES